MRVARAMWIGIAIVAGVIMLLVGAALVQMSRVEPDNSASLRIVRIPEAAPYDRVLNLSAEDVATFPANVRDAFEMAVSDGEAEILMSEDERHAWHAALEPIEAMQGGAAHHYRYKGEVLRAYESIT